MPLQTVTVVLLQLVLIPCCFAAPPRLEKASPESVGFNAEKLQGIDAVVERGITAGQMPGCVVLVGSKGKIVWLKAYGQRTQDDKLTTDTVFDLASLTKPIATATAVMKLVEDGKVKLDDPVAKHLPEFAANGKEKVTIEHLLTHQGGLITDNHLRDYQDGADKAWERIFALKPVAPIGERFIYSDVGFEVLGKLVERVSEQPLDAYLQTKFFQPLGMSDTTYRPNEALRTRAAPTEKRDGKLLQGEVHDPRAHLLGVAGHAGLFSTAEDLAIYAQMLLNQGEYGGMRVLKAETVDEMFRPRNVPGKSLRALGWDVRSGFSSNRGEGLSDRAVGHGGFTGTVLWIDPQRDLYYIFLASRLYPDGQGNVNKLAGEIGATIADAAP